MLMTVPETTLENLLSSGYEDIIAACESDPNKYYTALSKAGAEAIAKGMASQGFALGFIVAACSLMLRPSNLQSPFSPCIIYEDKTTSFKSSDFSKAQGILLAEFASSVKDPELAARLADLAWVVRRGNPITAKIAISNYIKAADSPYCQKQWAQRLKRLERALRLALSIKETASFDIIRGELIALLEPNHKFYSLIAIKDISLLLLELKLLDPIVIGEKIEVTTASHSVRDEFQYELLSVAAEAFLKGKDSDRANNTKIKAAEFLVKKAEQSKQPGQMIAASHFYSQAISALQQCKGQQKRVAELQPEFTGVIIESQKEMQQFSCSFDITEPVQNAILVMQNKDFNTAVLQFAYLCKPMSRKKLEDEAISIAKQSVFQSTNAKRIQNGDGRLVVIVPPLLGSIGDDYALALKWGAYLQALHQQSFVVQAIILPARNELVNLHPIDKKTLSVLLQDCPLFSHDRASLWIKGFLAGFYDDFDIALSILIPQFEHVLRKGLELRGATVWRVDPDTQIHSEKLLGELLSMDEARDFLGEDLQFELRGLLTEKAGFNLRNEFAHGLMSESDFTSVPAIYLWWLLFQMAIMSFKTVATQPSVITETPVPVPA
jgi:hypothetical protein